jgi:hypothetical protein
MSGMSHEKTTVVFWVIVLLSAVAAAVLFVGALWLFYRVPINP